MLVIIGLLVGGVLVGRDLISAAAVRAQISQIENYNAAVNSFRVKYSYLPGDIKYPDATNYGLATRGSFPGQGDGNGLLEGNSNNTSTGNLGMYQGIGETSQFWIDLSVTRLINVSLSYANSSGTIGSQHAPSYYMPEAKIGNNNYISVWSGGYTSTDATNYFCISTMTYISGGIPNAKQALTVKQAFSIDSKLDDGLPQSGNVLAVYDGNFPPAWSAGSGTGAASGSNGPTSNSTSGSGMTCYDNNSIGGATQQYSITQNNGSGVNCALSFKFQ